MHPLLKKNPGSAPVDDAKATKLRSYIEIAGHWEARRRGGGGAHLREVWKALYRRGLQTLSLFKTKNCSFFYPV